MMGWAPVDGGDTARKACLDEAERVGEVGKRKRRRGEEKERREKRARPK